MVAGESEDNSRSIKRDRNLHTKAELKRFGKQIWFIAVLILLVAIVDEFSLRFLNYLLSIPELIFNGHDWQHPVERLYNWQIAPQAISFILCSAAVFLFEALVLKQKTMVPPFSVSLKIFVTAAVFVLATFSIAFAVTLMTESNENWKVKIANESQLRSSLWNRLSNFFEFLQFCLVYIIIVLRRLVKEYGSFLGLTFAYCICLCTSYFLIFEGLPIAVNLFYGLELSAAVYLPLSPYLTILLLMVAWIPKRNTAGSFGIAFGCTLALFVWRPSDPIEKVGCFPRLCRPPPPYSQSAVFDLWKGEVGREEPSRFFYENVLQFNENTFSSMNFICIVAIIAILARVYHQESAAN